MVDVIDNYTEVVQGSIITIKGTRYIVKNGFILLYHTNKIIYLDGATLEKV